MNEIPAEDRKLIIGTVKDGSKSEYWNILRGQILQWIADENRIMDSFKSLSIRNQEDVDKYNRASDRREYLYRLLRINETIITYNQTILERFKEKTTELYKTTESFVKDFALNSGQK